MPTITWIRAIGITFLLLLVVAFSAFPYLIGLMENWGVALPSATIRGIELMSYVRKYWYICLVLGVVLTLIPTKSIENARIKEVEPYLLVIVIALMLLLIGVLALPLLSEMFAAAPQLKKK